MSIQSHVRSLLKEAITTVGTIEAVVCEVIVDEERDAILGEINGALQSLDNAFKMLPESDARGRCGMMANLTDAERDKLHGAVNKLVTACERNAAKAAALIVAEADREFGEIYVALIHATACKLTDRVMEGTIPTED